MRISGGLLRIRFLLLRISGGLVGISDGLLAIRFLLIRSSGGLIAVSGELVRSSGGTARDQFSADPEQWRTDRMQ